MDYQKTELTGTPLRGYFADLFFGKPAQRCRVILDSRSSDLIINSSEGCTKDSCGSRSVNGFYHYLKSETSRYLRCEDCQDDKKRCVQNKCYYRWKYPSESSLEGFLMNETVGLKGQNDTITASLNVGTSIAAMGDFYNMDDEGILGLAQDSQLRQWLKPDHQRYALCLSAQGGALYLGGYPQLNEDHPGVWFPGAKYEDLSLQNLSLFHPNSSEPPLYVHGGTLKVHLDVRRTKSRWPQPLVEKLVSSLQAYPTVEQPGFDHCWTLNSTQLADLPRLRLDTQEGSLEWDYQSYLPAHPQSNTTHCLYATPSNQAPFLLSSLFFVNHTLIMDYQKDQLGIWPTECPLNTQPTELTQDKGPLPDIPTKQGEDLSFLEYSLTADLTWDLGFLVGGVLVASLCLFCLARKLRRYWIVSQYEPLDRGVEMAPGIDIIIGNQSDP